MALSDSLPQINLSVQDYVEVRHPQTTSKLLQIIDKNRQENWRETRGNNRYLDNSRPRREFNRFEGQGVADNRRFDGGQSDHRFHNQSCRQGGSRNGSFRGQNDQNRYLNFYAIDASLGVIKRDVQKILLIRKKKAKFNWSKEAQDAFNKVKQALTEAPVLQLPNFQEQFNLFTDAIGVGIGAVLNQNHRPIAIASRTLNKAERNYTVTERECLAVIWALNKFKIYFGSLPVKCFAYRMVMSVQMFLKCVSELTDEDEGYENEVNTAEIIVNDVPGCLEVRNGDRVSSLNHPQALFVRQRRAEKSLKTSVMWDKK
ncbi:retrovirus-related Pol polyprotein from transposon 297 [Trichonephila clavipes]|nr:retrovirus-related Pol polyprotein from transposon 297 [Trichonephila clavipes]